MNTLKNCLTTYLYPILDSTKCIFISSNKLFFKFFCTILLFDNLIKNVCFSKQYEFQLTFYKYLFLKGKNNNCRQQVLENNNVI